MEEWNSGKKKPAGRKYDRLFDAVVAILKYQKGTIENGIYIKVFSDGKVS